VNASDAVDAGDAGEEVDDRVRVRERGGQRAPVVDVGFDGAGAEALQQGAAARGAGDAGDPVARGRPVTCAQCPDAEKCM
jgi:hypothetical protein